jgi:hypothetical protein
MYVDKLDGLIDTAFFDGFTFDHLGGFEGDTGPDLRARGMAGGTNGRDAIPTTAPLPMSNSPPHLRALATATPSTRAVVSVACGNAKNNREWPSFGLDSFSIAPASVSEA